LKSWSKKQTTN